MANERNPENTRLKILVAAFNEMHQNGFQGLRIDQVLNATGLKKGALYHHFPSKQALGYAVLDDLITTRINELWIDPLKNYDDPLEGIQNLYEQVGKFWSDEFFYLGCPLNNLAQEMSPIDEGFRDRIETFFKYWATALANALVEGQKKGIVDDKIAVDECAVFIIAAIEGSLSMTKNQQNKEVYYNCGRELRRYLNSLRKN